MKTAVKIFFLLILTSSLAKGQTVYNITSDITISAGFPSSYNNYVINISTGVTVTLNMDITLSNTIINGGTIITSNKLTYYSGGGSFNNTTIKFKGSGNLVTSGVLNLNNSVFEFSNNATATIWTSLNMDNSRMKFTDNSSMEITQGNFNMKNTSSIVVGDGTTTSKAFVKFNGATLNEYDNSFVTIANYNNYYFNWANYNTLVNNKSVKTTNNTLNCGTIGKNACSAPVVYGPATLSYGGVSSSAVLPVKLSSFGLKEVNGVVEISWTTQAEVNADHFDVERSIDGITWGTTGTVKAAGNSSQVSSYSYKDALKVSGKIYYRLKMADKDGVYEYSPIRSINAISAVEMNIYPNPATNYVVINSKNGAADQLHIQLISQNGQILKSVSGSGNTVIPVSDFKTGNYIVRVTNGNNMSQSFKLMITK
jgi:hypothetical protein